EEDLGLAVLTNRWPGHGGFFFYTYVLNLLLESRFGLNRGANEAVVAEYRDAVGRLTDLAAEARPVAHGAIASFLGSYERGYGLAYDTSGAVRLHLSARPTRVLALPDGSGVAASGLIAGRSIRFVRDQTGVPVIELEGLEAVRWLSGPA